MKRDVATAFRGPSAIPIVSLADIRTRVYHSVKVDCLMIPFYEVWENSRIRARAEGKDIHDKLGFSQSIGLSSVGPDDYVMSEAYFVDFIRYALEGNFDFVVAWDAPTYVDMPTNLSWRNTVFAAEQVRRMLRTGIPVVGLLNGANSEQYDRCADLLKSLGINYAAVHVSDYLRHRDDTLLMELMWDALRIASSKFDNVLIVGATDPFLIRYPLKQTYPNASVTGLSWFIDATHGRAYSARGKVNAYETDVLCDCSYCSKRPPGTLSRSSPDRAIHNFSVVQDAMTGKEFPEVELVDIVQQREKIVVVSDIHLGTNGSLVSNFSKAMRKEKPEVIVFLGDTFDLVSLNYELLHEQANSFFGLLYDIGCDVFPVFGGADSSLRAVSDQLRRTAYNGEIHPNLDFTRYMIMGLDQFLYRIFKFYIAARESLSIRLATGRTLFAAHGPPLSPEMPSDEKVCQLLKEKRCDCVVLGGYHSKLVKDNEFYSLGAWQVQTLEQEQSKLKPDLRGALVVDKKGIRYKEFGG